MKNSRSPEDFQSVPVISFADFKDDDSAGRMRVAQKIQEACEKVGFMYLSDHGVPQEKIDRLFGAAKEFFALPEAVKLDHDLQSTPEWNRGYQAFGAKQYANATSPDLNEAFKFQRELEANDPDIVDGNRVHRLNKWPNNTVVPAMWRLTLLDYFGEMEKLSGRLLRAFALALDLPEDHFAKYYRKPITQISLLHYPPQEPKLDTDYGIRPHTDDTSFTILAQDDVGGIQVQSGDKWVDARPIPGTFLINIGNMMARWTNDRFASTMHRVYNHSGKERYSAPFFAIPDFDTVVECLPNCVAPGEAPKFAPMHVGQSLQKRFSSNWTGQTATPDTSVRA
ncbi:isopenicillin N synthase family dioxygenase [Caballeronia sp. HLA56]